MPWLGLLLASPELLRDWMSCLKVLCQYLLRAEVDLLILALGTRQQKLWCKPRVVQCSFATGGALCGLSFVFDPLGQAVDVEHVATSQLWDRLQLLLLEKLEADVALVGPDVPRKDRTENSTLVGAHGGGEVDRLWVLLVIFRVVRTANDEVGVM